MWWCVRRASLTLSRRAQLLAARRAGGAGLHQDGRQLAKARMAMRTLERNLQGELTTVQAVLGSYDVKGSTTLASSDSDSNSDRAAWEKRTIQRGAMRGESTQKQLTRVLEKDLSDKVAKKLKWSRADLANAAEFANYLKAHPLPALDTKPDRGTSRLQEGGETVTGKKEDNGIIKVTFKREMSMTDKQYREMEDALQDAYAGDASASTGTDDAAATTATGTNTARLAKVLERALQEDARVPTHKPTHVAQKVQKAQKAQSTLATHPHPETWSVPRAEGEEVRRILEKVLGAGKVGKLSPATGPAQARAPAHSSGTKYVVQPGDTALSVANHRGHKWAEHEVLREHGNFVHLPPRHGFEPLAVQPYYW